MRRPEVPWTAMLCLAALSGLAFPSGCEPGPEQVNRSIRADEVALSRRLGVPVLLVNSESYASNVARFRITASEAAAAARRLAAKSNRLPYPGRHHLVIGDDYLFSAPSKRGLPLDGITVNGMTGDIGVRETLEYIPWGHLACGPRRLEQP